MHVPREKWKMEEQLAAAGEEERRVSTKNQHKIQPSRTPVRRGLGMSPLRYPWPKAGEEVGEHSTKNHEEVRGVQLLESSPW
jgi:hypothetical protein